MFVFDKFEIMTIFWDINSFNLFITVWTLPLYSIYSDVQLKRQWKVDILDIVEIGQTLFP